MVSGKIIDKIELTLDYNMLVDEIDLGGEPANFTGAYVVNIYQAIVTLQF
jgi:hypothetical protein